MQFKKLENDIIDFIQEQQLKIGYCRESVRIYYTADALTQRLGAANLADFAASVSDRLGELAISRHGGRFCITVPPQGVDYVYSLPLRDTFLPDLLNAVSAHPCTMEQILAAFHRHSDHVHVEKMDGEDFDTLVYFADGVPNSYRYCFHTEGEHIIYHRFSEEDYRGTFGA